MEQKKTPAGAGRRCHMRFGLLAILHKPRYSHPSVKDLQRRKTSGLQPRLCLKSPVCDLRESGRFGKPLVRSVMGFYAPGQAQEKPITGLLPVNR